MSYYARKPERKRGGSSYGGQRSNNQSRGPRRGQYINPALFVRAAENIEVAPYEPTHQFQDFNVSPILMNNLTKKGITIPTPIQDQTIPQAMEGKDIIGIANTGTGKTIAFAIPLLNKLIEDKSAKALIIAPTRELAEQIQDECRWIAKGSGLFGALLIGGTAMGPQLRDLRAGPRIVIGTPGRIKDHMEQRTLDLAGFNMIVLDEVDRMLDMGFINDVRFILNKLSEKRQSLFFSATLDNKVSDLIHGFVHDPVKISLKTSEGSKNVHQDVVLFNTPHDKLDKLHDILIQTDVEKILVFDETQRNVERLSKELVVRGFKADAIHGGKSQGQRKRALDRFRHNDIKILVATDVAARGIDVTDITHVINYSQPQSYEDYIHRIGRTGRAGRTGQALTFVGK
jgi:ATP-dependent RNA helicase RhlE